MKYAVETTNLVKRFECGRSILATLKGQARDYVQALDDVSIQVHEKEIFGLVGSNAAGKTTLINVLCTFIIPTAGSAWVGGFDVLKDSVKARALVGLVTSNERSFYWRLSGRENLRFFAALYGLAYTDVVRWIEELIDCLDLKSFADRRFDAYSTGVRQRFALARALLHKPQILFMDEPTKGLDPIAAAAFVRLVRERIVDTWNPTVIVTSHNLREIEQLCERVAIMHAGRIVCSGRIDELGRNLVPYETYRLSVGKVGHSIVESIQRLGGVLAVKIAHSNGRMDLDLQIDRSQSSLSAVLRTLLSDGGEVYECTQSSVSLERVLYQVVGHMKEHD